MKILILNGPNLNKLGEREPHIYGHQPFDKYIKRLDERYPEVVLEYFQSNHEGDLIDKLHNSNCDGIVFNPGGYSHTSIAIADALMITDAPVIEVHISNIHGRELYRQNLVTGANCAGVISGLGLEVYRLAIDSFWEKYKESKA